MLRKEAELPTCRVYLPPPAAQRIDQAAKRVCLSRVEFVRAVALSVADQLTDRDQAASHPEADDEDVPED